MAAARKQFAEVAYAGNDSLTGMRLKAGLSQAALAEKARTTQPYIAKIESGTVDPGTEVIARLAYGLGVEPARVFNAILQARNITSGT
ncbi:MAG: helix-turn-helix transcriptional regulator [Gammaproteobacteria bacterium]|nr:helix-turn-helix transcriptional regulator [Gammaproteobacteria bacterium]